MGDFWLPLLPFVFLFGWQMGQSSRPQTCPKCGATVAPVRLSEADSRRSVRISFAIAIASILIAGLVALWSASSVRMAAAVPRPVAVPPPLVSPKGPPA